ncbi:DUF3455 domain-containing protein [Rhodoplanes sp. Z2-YC6860]|uniref:DUF3455 domain-containing protein n=1 Tax=Rhodoplanes sp. Z2-YC6860 TaxID=674703 RepID=UPI003FA757A2
MSLAGLLTVALVSAAASAEIPAAIAVSGETLVVRLHAEGAQVYECKADASGKLAWQFREPIATLIEGGKTVGRHYAGPHWALDDGSIVAAKAVGRASGATAQDIPLLKLEATSHAGKGRLTDVTTVLRLDTKGGNAEGACPAAGALLSAPYSADYAFYRKGN